MLLPVRLPWGWVWIGGGVVENWAVVEDKVLIRSKAEVRKEDMLKDYDGRFPVRIRSLLCRGCSSF